MTGFLLGFVGAAVGMVLMVYICFGHEGLKTLKAAIFGDQ